MLAALLAILFLISGFALLVVEVANHRTPYNPIRVACVGDSITQGSGYPNALQDLLGPTYKVANFGVGGSAINPNSEKPYASQPTYQIAQMYNPDIVVIMLGTNDAKQSSQRDIENFTTNYEKLVMQFQALRSSPDVWLVEPPPILNNTLDLAEAHLVEDVIPGIKQAASDLNLPMIDVHLALSDQPELLCDGVHPTNEGAQVIAEQVSQAIISNATSDFTQDYLTQPDANSY